MTNITIRYKRLYVIFLILSTLLTLAPVTVYTIKALIESDLVHEKVSLMLTVFIVLILTCVTIVNKQAMRSRLWIMLIGLYICLDYIMGPLIIIAVCQVVDELIVCPAKKGFKEKYSINKQIDRRV